MTEHVQAFLCTPPRRWRSHQIIGVNGSTARATRGLIDFDYPARAAFWFEFARVGKSYGHTNLRWYRLFPGSLLEFNIILNEIAKYDGVRWPVCYPAFTLLPASDRRYLFELILDSWRAREDAALLVESLNMRVFSSVRKIER